MLVEREIEILTLFIQGEKHFLDELAEIFRVSTRTIRYNLDNIDYFLKKNRIEPLKKNDHKQIYLEASKDKVQILLNNLTKDSAEERKNYILLKILTENFFNFSEESKILGVSRETLRKDFKQIFNEIVDKYHISFLSLPSKGIRISGKDEDIRFLLKNITIKIFKQNYFNSGKEIKKILENILKSFPIEYFEKIQTHIKEKYNKELSKEDFNELFFIIAINCFFSKKNSNFDLKNSLEDYEKIWIYDIFKRNSNFSQNKVAFMLEELKNKLNLPLEFSSEFILQLSLYIDEKEFYPIFSQEDLEKKEKLFFSEIYNLFQTTFIDFSYEKFEQLYFLIRGEIKRSLMKNYESKVILISNLSPFFIECIKKTLKDSLNIKFFKIIPQYIYEIFDFSFKEDALFLSTENISVKENISVLKISKIISKKNLDEIGEYILKKSTYPTIK